MNGANTNVPTEEVNQLWDSGDYNVSEERQRLDGGICDVDIPYGSCIAINSLRCLAIHLRARLCSLSYPFYVPYP